jgi:trimeric autotransporter adhesin
MPPRDGIFGIVLLCSASALSHMTPAAAAMRASDFLNTLGVNTHVGANPYNDSRSLLAMLSYLGIWNIRQSSPTNVTAAVEMERLGEAGARIDIIINGGGPVDLQGAMRTVKQLAPYLNAVEGVNEAANYPMSYNGWKGIDAAVNLQKDLYHAVRTEPGLSHAPVYIFTLGGVDPGAFPQIGDLSAYTDYANIHSYPPHGLRPCFVIHAAVDGGRTDAPSKPIVITETGFYTLPQNNGWGGVPESVQASYLLDELFDEAAAGISRTYIYDLIDDGVDPKQTDRESHFGLFRYDGTPKPSATAIRNLTQILADKDDTAEKFPQREFAFTVSGVPYHYTGNTLALEKANGTNIIAIWNEQQLWNPDTQTATPVQHLAVSVAFSRIYPVVRMYDPILSAAPVQAFSNVSQISVDLTDHPLILEIPPDSP